MTLELEDARKSARLSRLALRDEELSAFTHDLARIVSYVAQLQELDVSDVEPLYHPHDHEVSLRADEVREGVGRRGLQDSAAYEDGLIRVPKVVE